MSCSDAIIQTCHLDLEFLNVKKKETGGSTYGQVMFVFVESPSSGAVTSLELRLQEVLIYRRS